MKYVLTALFAAALLSNTSAQTPDVRVSVVRTVRTASIEPVSADTNTNTTTQVILDKLQQESENSVLYPLVRMSQLAIEKVEGLKDRARVERKAERKQGRIRTNNTKQRTVNPNRA
jgi:hypothetical protein